MPENEVGWAISSVNRVNKEALANRESAVREKRKKLEDAGWQCLAAGDLAAADRYFLRAFRTTFTRDAAPAYQREEPAEVRWRALIEDIECRKRALTPDALRVFEAGLAAGEAVARAAVAATRVAE